MFRFVLNNPLRRPSPWWLPGPNRGRSGAAVPDRRAWSDPSSEQPSPSSPEPHFSLQPRMTDVCMGELISTNRRPRGEFRSWAGGLSVDCQQAGRDQRAEVCCFLPAGAARDGAWRRGRGWGLPLTGSSRDLWVQPWRTGLPGAPLSRGCRRPPAPHSTVLHKAPLLPSLACPCRALRSVVRPRLHGTRAA